MNTQDWISWLRSTDSAVALNLDRLNDAYLMGLHDQLWLVTYYQGRRAALADALDVAYEDDEYERYQSVLGRRLDDLLWQARSHLERAVLRVDDCTPDNLVSPGDIAHHSGYVYQLELAINVFWS